MMNSQRSLLDPIQQILASLEKVKATSSNQWKALCPAHDDKMPSLSISENEDKILLHCHAGCTAEQIVTALGMSMSDLFKCETEYVNPNPIQTRENSHKSRVCLGDIVAEYNYTDLTGKLIYQVVRDEDKNFRQRQPKDSGGYIWNMTNIPRVLYNLPAIARAKKDEWIFVVEGEKDADALGDIGFTATTNPGGAGKWKHLSDDSPLHDKRIAIIPDCDNPGQKHALDVAKHLHGVAKEIRIVDLSEGDSFTGKDVSDWLESSAIKETEARKQALMKKVEASSPWTEEEWQQPQTCREYIGLAPKFPIEVFPIWLRNMVSDLAVSTQTPVDLAGSIALGVLALVGGGKVKIQAKPDWKEPLNLYIAIAMPSGSRKSAVYSSMIAPLEEWEETEQRKSVDKIARSTTEYDIMKQQLISLKKKIILGEEEHREKALDLSAKLNKTIIPVPPRLTCSDATPEAVTRLLAEQNGRMGLFSPEGGMLISIISGRYSNGKSNMDVFLNAHTGEKISADRADPNRKPIILRYSALTIVLCMQPNVLEYTWQNGEFKDRGLLGRILWVLPPNLLGKRKIDVPCVAEQVKSNYNDNIQYLLDLLQEMSENEPVTLMLSDGAYALLQDFRRKEEPKLALDGQYKDMTSWGSKLPGAVLRMAGLLHLAQNALCAEKREEPIKEQTMEDAISLGDFFTSHVLRINEVYGGTSESRMTQRILNRIKFGDMKSFIQRDLYRVLGTKNEDIIKPLKLLQEKGYIRLVENQKEKSKSSAGRKPSPEWEVNPLFLEDSVNSGNCGIGGLDE